MPSVQPVTVFCLHSVASFLSPTLPYPAGGLPPLPERLQEAGQPVSLLFPPLRVPCVWRHITLASESLQSLPFASRAKSALVPAC